MELNGKVALITGASKGLGLEIAQAYADRGAKLVIAARGRESLDAAEAELRKRTDVLAIAVDVSEDAELVVRAATQAFGRIDVLVNNASELGPSPMPALADYPWQSLERVLRVNVLAPLHLTQLVLPGMRERGEGVIINVSSDAGVEAYPGWGGYGASKAALEHLSRTLGAELEGTDVRVYCVDPGDMNTEMHQLAEPGVDLSGLPHPSEAAPAFVYLVERETAPFARVKAQELSHLRKRGVMVTATRLHTLDFALPPELEARIPPEARGLRRDEVRLMVSHRESAAVDHGTFSDLPRFLRAGDLLVVNDSATLPAATTARREDGSEVALHFSTQLGPDVWVVEPRRTHVNAGEMLRLQGGGRVMLLQRHHNSPRLWVAGVSVPGGVIAHLQRHGKPITYDYLDGEWPIEMYHTIFATKPGSAEMPSAARPFSTDVVAELERSGVHIATITLHTGVASLEKDEAPYEESYEVPPETADAIEETHANSRRVIAVGTTVVRTLESAVDDRGRVQPFRGWTDLVITAERGVRAVDGLLTGFHEPRATHLAMLEAIAGPEHVRLAYAAALEGRYLWHEFGDVHLIV